MNLFEIVTYRKRDEKTSDKWVGLVIADHINEVIEHLKMDLIDENVTVETIKDRGPIYSDLRKEKKEEK